MFELNEEKRLIKKNVHDFAKKELAPQAAHWDTSEEFPWESVKKMADIGLTGLRLPTPLWRGRSGSDHLRDSHGRSGPI